MIWRAFVLSGAVLAIWGVLTNSVPLLLVGVALMVIAGLPLRR